MIKEFLKQQYSKLFGKDHSIESSSNKVRQSLLKAYSLGYFIGEMAKRHQEQGINVGDIDSINRNIEKARNGIIELGENPEEVLLKIANSFATGEIDDKNS